MTESAELPKPRLFISYAHADESDGRWKTKFLPTLRALRTGGIIDFFEDDMIEVGDEWDDRLRRELDAFDLIVFLVSTAFLASGYIETVEVERALERHEAKEAHILPILVKPCDLTYRKWAKVQAFPRHGPDARPLCFWEKRGELDDALTQISERIRTWAAGWQARHPPLTQNEDIPTSPPNRGLLAFEAEDKDDFFGRADLTDKLWNAVSANRQTRRRPSESRPMSRPEDPIDVFISYKREERDIAKALAEALARRGYKVWWDIELLPGDRFVDSIMAVLSEAKAVIVLWSRAAVASDFVRAEARHADEQDKLIPARLDDCRLPLPFGERHILDLRGWWPTADEDTLEPLLRALEARVGKPPAPRQQPATVEANLHARDHEAEFWRAVSERQPQSDREYEIYLETFPNGVFVALARHRIEELRKPQPGKTETKGKVTPKDTSIGRGGAEVLPWAPPRGLPVPDMIRIPSLDVRLPVSFTMGSTAGAVDEQPSHPVTFARPFLMSRTPVTFEHYVAFARDTGRKAPSPADFGWTDASQTLPVVGVSWHDARAYADWLGTKTGARCRLPSEAEWEFACRAGTTTAYWWGDTFKPTMANTAESGRRRPTPVGEFPENPWRLYDMSGNAWEWIVDHWHDSYANAPQDGSAWIDESAHENSPRVLRGGSWVSAQLHARCAKRHRNNPSYRYFNVGFRVVCSSPS